MTVERIQGCDDESFGLDEIVARGMIHMERMSRDHFWMQIHTAKETVTVNFHIKKRTIWANVLRECCGPICTGCRIGSLPGDRNIDPYCPVHGRPDQPDAPRLGVRA